MLIAIENLQRAEENGKGQSWFIFHNQKRTSGTSKPRKRGIAATGQMDVQSYGQLLKDDLHMYVCTRSKCNAFSV